MVNEDRSRVPEGVSANVLVTAGVLNPAAAMTELHLGDGRTLRVPTALLEAADARSELEEAVAPVSEDGLAVPIVEEQLHVAKRVVKTGTVRLQKTVEAFDAVVDEVLAARTFEVERVTVNLPVEEAPQVRREGDVTIFPVVEEQAIVTKQLVLKEEIRVTQRDTEQRDPQMVTLRREVVAVEREPA